MREPKELTSENYMIIRKIERRREDSRGVRKVSQPFPGEQREQRREQLKGSPAIERFSVNRAGPLLLLKQQPRN